jgi:diguanylate cyclase (GGDEF)-like protein
MSSPNILYSTLLFLAGMACLVVAALVWQQRRSAEGAGFLILFMLALSWWDVTYAVFWAGVPGPTPSFWLDMTYVGVVIVPPAFLAFTIQFSQLNWLKPPFLLALAIEPVLVLLLFWTDPWHGLFFAGKRIQNAGMILEGGPVFWANIVYSYLLLLFAYVLLVQRFRHTKGLYRRQTAMLLLAAGIPWLSSIIFLLGLNLLPNADNTPFAFSLTALAFAYALLRYRMLDVMPIARHVLIENMNDGVMVLDAQNRVVDLNLAAQTDLNLPTDFQIGEPVEKILSPWPKIAAQFLDMHQAHIELALDASPQAHLDLSITPLVDRRGQFVGRLIVWRDITRLKQVQAELEKHATMDALTQVFNRRHFLELAEQELKRTKRFRHTLVIVLMDIDYFKQINDTFGHAAGDQVLYAFAKLCRENIREMDIFARFGGEEFVLLMPETGLDQAYGAVERLRLKVMQASFSFGKQRAAITCSFGLAAYAKERDTLDMVLHRADQALYTAKQTGRNCVVR